MEHVLDVGEAVPLATEAEQHARIETAAAVAMTSPSSTLNPIVVAMLRPSCSAQRLAPDPRWTAMARPRARTGDSCAKRPAMDS